MTSYPPIGDLVPHSPPTLAIEELVEYGDGHAHARLHVRDGGLLVRDGSADAVVTLEHMAQAVAACLGYKAFLGGGAVRVGMVVACRQFTLMRDRLAVGERLDVRVTWLRGTDDVSSFEGEVRDERGALVSTAVMTLVHADRPPD